MSDISPTRRALALAFAIVGAYYRWNGEDRYEIVGDDALNVLAETADSLDFGQVEGVIASPLKYFVGAILRDQNPEDLTYVDMVDSLAISIRVLTEA
jgi:hypothetical protein